MLRREDGMVIQAFARRGLYLCDIAKQVGMYPRTVRRALDWVGAPRLGPASGAVGWKPIGQTWTGCWPITSGTRW